MDHAVLLRKDVRSSLSSLCKQLLRSPSGRRQGQGAGDAVDSFSPSRDKHLLPDKGPEGVPDAEPKYMVRGVE